MTREELIEIVAGRPEVEILAATAWAEARNQGVVGMAAVASTVKNRKEARIRRYGSTWAGVCTRDRQFSCWNIYDDGRQDPNLSLILNGPSGAEWYQALAIAELAMKNLLVDVTGGATHYFVATMKNPPAWAKSPQMRHLRDIGAHRFYFEV